MAAALEGASPAERVLEVTELAAHLMVLLAGAGDAKDLGHAACVCKALRAASAAERAWEIACAARFSTSLAAKASLEGAAASGFSWRAHFMERVKRPWTAGDGLAVSASLADMALLLVDVWHRGNLVFSAALSPAADEQLDDECYSDSDDQDFDSEWKAEFAIENETHDAGRYGRNRYPAFVGAGQLRASAWLLRREGRLERVMCRTPAELETVAEGSVAWAGSRRFVFTGGATKPGVAVSLHLAGWLVEDKTGYRWWPVQGPRPAQRDPRRLTRLCVRWQPPATDED
jgi:hypothetical protein